FGNTDSRVAQACLYTCGSMLAAAKFALESPLGVACSPSSGFHHAYRSHGGGFCTFNGLALTAVWMAQRRVKVAILDCDYHYGDGTVDILAQHGNLGIAHYSSGAHFDRSTAHEPPAAIEDPIESDLAGKPVMSTVARPGIARFFGWL